MIALKEIAKKIIDGLPEESTHQEIMRELAFDKIIQRGIEDAKKGHTAGDTDIKKKI